jgi:hypothetical protein
MAAGAEVVVGAEGAAVEEGAIAATVEFQR